MIIDYHLRGEHEKLEEQFPELAEKSKKFLGYELYTDLAVTQAIDETERNKRYVPLEPSDPMFKVLLNK